jgi:hypothetical protein
MHLRLRMIYRSRIVIYRWRYIMMDRRSRIMSHRRRCRMMHRRRCRMIRRRRMIHHRSMRRRGSHTMARRIPRSVRRRGTRKIGCRIRGMIRRGARYRQGRRPPVINRRKLIPVNARIMLLRHLCRSRLHVLFMCSRLFRRSRPRTNPARPTIITDPVGGCIVYDSTVNIGIVNDRSVDIDHRRIISEMTTYPITTGKA